MMAIYIGGYWLLLAACTCFLLDSSVTMATHNFGIHGGKPVNITEVPFFGVFTGQTRCGASIVHKRFMVTTAGCAKSGVESISVGGDHLGQGDIYEVEKVFPHPKCENALDCDIAVIKVGCDFEFSDRVQPIRMADPSVKPSSGDMMATIGLGVQEDQTMSSILLKVDLPYVDRQTCNENYKKLNTTVTERMICAGGEAGKSGCIGDSGGALLYKGELIGATSWFVVPCGQKGFPTVFANVPSMMDFINEVIKNNS